MKSMQVPSSTEKFYRHVNQVINQVASSKDLDYNCFRAQADSRTIDICYFNQVASFAANSLTLTPPDAPL